MLVPLSLLTSSHEVCFPITTHSPSAIPLRLRNQCEGQGMAMLKIMPMPMPMKSPEARGAKFSLLTASQLGLSFANSFATLFISQGETGERQSDDGTL
jgi:hypothetical protein